MSKRQRGITEAVIARRIKEGRGKGRGIDYKPWLTTQDVPSDGLAHRKSSWTVGREHQLMSTLELHYMFIFDWFSSIIDIREQFPLLPLKDTMAIAEELGINHPVDPETKELNVVTTDFVITIRDGDSHIDRAVAVKPAAKLQDPRVIEKLEIERTYWRTAGVDWCIATQKDLNPHFVANVQFLHDYHQLPEESLSEQQLADIITTLSQHIHTPIALTQIAANCDTALGLVRGTSLPVAYHLIATRQWYINLRVPLNPSKPLAFCPPLPSDCADMHEMVMSRGDVTE
jgi:hypothetical protein